MDLPATTVHSERVRGVNGRLPRAEGEFVLEALRAGHEWASDPLLV